MTQNERLQAALEYATQYNWPVFPVSQSNKKPIGSLAPNGCHSAVTDPTQVEAWWGTEPNNGIGGATGGRSGFFVLDVDVKGTSDGKLSLQQLENEHGPLPPTVLSETPTGGLHWFFRYPPGVTIPNSVEGVGPGLDIRGEGGYVVLPPSRNGTGGYQWLNAPSDLPVADPPPWLLRLVLELATKARGVVELVETETSTQIPEGRRNTALKSLAGRLRRSGMTVEEIFWTLSVVNKRRCVPPLDKAEVVRLAKGNAKYSASIDVDQQAKAILAGDDMLVGQLDRLFGPVELPPLEKVIEAVRAEDAGDGRLAVMLHKKQVLYYEPQKAWYVFDGLHWKAYPAETIRQVLVGRVAQVYVRTSALCMEQVTKGDPANRAVADLLAKRAALLMHVRKQAEILKNVQGALTRNDDERNPATYVAWDADPNVLAVRNGVIDLQTGRLRPTQPEDYIRTVAPVVWEGITARCPEWRTFLMHIHSEDAELVRFMQRLYGYATTGHARDHYITILYGPRGRNGKGVALEMLGNVLGDYALAVSKNILVDTGRPQAPSAATPHLAQLRGKRLVWCSETKEDEKADAGLLKYLSGEDTVNARGLYEQGSTFKPTHTLILATNHRPHLPATDDATWERIIQVELRRRYIEDPDPGNPDEFRCDPLLKERLGQELSGILAWLVRGAMKWYRQGLNRPASTKKATHAYRAVEDWGTRWLDARCKRDPRATTLVEDLYADFETWWDRTDRTPSKTAFGRRLSEMGFERIRDARTNRFARVGIALRGGGASTLDQPVNFEEVDNDE